MALDLEVFRGAAIDTGTTTHEAAFEALAMNVLERNHGIHAYTGTGSARKCAVLLQQDGRLLPDPLLGFGVDGSAELAMLRALGTFFLRERDGLSEVTSETYPHTVSTHRFDRNVSVFDRIVWNWEAIFTLNPKTGLVVVKSPSSESIPGRGSVGEADTVLGAIEQLAASWKRKDGHSRAKKLPAYCLD